MLDKRFKSALKKYFLTQKEIFFKSSMVFYEEAKKHPYYHMGLYSTLWNDIPQLFDEDYTDKIMQRSFEKKDNPTFNDYGLKFDAIGQNKPRPIDAYYKLKYQEKQDQALDAFWKIDENIENFSKWTDFSPFLDLTLSKTEAEKYLKANDYQVLNHEGWLAYINSLLKNAYKDFLFDSTKSTTTILRFLKQINEELFFGFEYSLKELKYQHKNGNLCLPDINIIILDKDFKKSLKNYHNLFNDSIWVIDLLKHPFLSIWGLEYFYNMETFAPTENGQYFHKNLALRQELSHDRVRLYNSDFFGEKLKRFAYYEVMVSAHFNHIYLNYIESSIRHALTEV